jgi:hypothetical protein
MLNKLSIKNQKKSDSAIGETWEVPRYSGNAIIAKPYRENYSRPRVASRAAKYFPEFHPRFEPGTSGAMPEWAYITIGTWLVVQLPIGMLLGRRLRGVRRTYSRVTELRESHKQACDDARTHRTTTHHAAKALRPKIKRSLVRLSAAQPRIAQRS